MKKILLSSVLAMMFVLPLQAQEAVQLPAGHTALNISATEKVEVEQDMLIASLRIQKEGETAKEVQEYINKRMATAMASLKKVKSLKIETGRYYVHPDYRYIDRKDGSNERVIDQWRGSQSVTIKGLVAEDILTMAGKLQDMDFVMNSLNYQLSPKKYDEIRDGLMEKTVEALMVRAKRVGKALNKSNVDLVEINVDARNNTPRPMYARAAKMEMMAMSSDAAMPAPVAEAGETTVSMSVSARAILKP
jgi:uncharacterized protein YggE